MAKFTANLVQCIIAVMLMAGCKPSVPSDVLSRGDMEDVLYDFHIGQSLASQQSDRAEMERIYEDAVLRKHGVTKEEFDYSLNYYMRHTEELATIYENLEERMKLEAASLGVSSSEMGQMTALGTTGDTANVWSGARSMVLMPKVPFNQHTFAIKCDTSFHAGDALALNFDCSFIFQDGRRNGCALLAVTLMNDSVISTFVQISNTTHHTLNLRDYARIGIKEIRGYFVLSKNQSEMENKTTLQLMFIDNVHLVRIHHKVPADMPKPIEPDTTKMPKPSPGTIKPVNQVPSSPSVNAIKSSTPIRPDIQKLTK